MKPEEMFRDIFKGSIYTRAVPTDTVDRILSSQSLTASVGGPAAAYAAWLELVRSNVIILNGDKWEWRG